MPRVHRALEHLLRRAGFGAGIDDLAPFEEMSVPASVEYLVDYERVPDDVDSKIGQSGYVGVTARGQFSPNTNRLQQDRGLPGCRAGDTRDGRQAG